MNKKTFKIAEKILLYLKENEMMLTRGVILVGNKTDLERQREVSTQGLLSISVFIYFKRQYNNDKFMMRCLLYNFIKLIMSNMI